MSNNDTIDLCDTSTDSIIILDSSAATNGDDLFFMDTTQCDELHNSAYATHDKESFSEASGVISHVATLDSKVVEKRKKNLCFNCMGEHALAVCTEPKDNRRIAKNRENFLGSRYRNSRLHEQKTNGFIPGQISDNLREALGISHNGLPEWIFRMRKRGFINGYPPAYLKRAIEKNVLSFVTDSEDVDDADLTLDRKKLYAYPGFNKFVRGIKDPEHFNIPSWDEFIRMHEEAIKRRNRSRNVTTKRTNSKSSRRAPLAKRPRKVVDRLLEEGEIVDDESFLDSTNDFQNDMDNSKITVTSEPCATVTKGTTILMSRSISMDDFNHEVQKPDLEKFAKDIVPFEHRNISKDSGFFSKMLSMVKGLKRKKT